MTEIVKLGQHQILVPFKGQRNYIQGPDLVDLAMSHLADCGLVRARFSSHEFLRTGALLLTVSEEDPKVEAPFRGQVSTQTGQFWLRIEAAEEVHEQSPRIPFDETLITGPSRRNGESIYRLGPSPYSLTETVVSLKKALLEELHPSGDRKWIFTSVDYRAFPSGFNEVSVRIDHNFQNKLVKSSILVDGELAGLLYFSLVSA